MINNVCYKYYGINLKAVGWDSGIPLRLSNFLENILQPTSFKMSHTSNLALNSELKSFKFLIYSLINFSSSGYLF